MIAESAGAFTAANACGIPSCLRRFSRIADYDPLVPKLRLGTDFAKLCFASPIACWRPSCKKCEEGVPEPSLGTRKNAARCVGETLLEEKRIASRPDSVG